VIYVLTLALYKLLPAPVKVMGGYVLTGVGM